MPFQRAITLGTNLYIVPSLVQSDAGTPTTYMSIWYVMHVLNTLGVKNTWDGHHWNLETSRKVTFTHVHPGQGTMSITLDGKKLMQRVTGVYAVDPYTGKVTTYMPIWYVMQLANRMGIIDQWNGTTWSLADTTQHLSINVSPNTEY